MRGQRRKQPEVHPFSQNFFFFERKEKAGSLFAMLLWKFHHT